VVSTCFCSKREGLCSGLQLKVHWSGENKVYAASDNDIFGPLMRSRLKTKLSGFSPRAFDNLTERYLFFTGRLAELKTALANHHSIAL